MEIPSDVWGPLELCSYLRINRKPGVKPRAHERRLLTVKLIMRRSGQAVSLGTAAGFSGFLSLAGRFPWDLPDSDGLGRFWDLRARMVVEGRGQQKGRPQHPACVRVHLVLLGTRSPPPPPSPGSSASQVCSTSIEESPVFLLFRKKHREGV